MDKSFFSSLRVANYFAAHVWWLALLSHGFVLFWWCALIDPSHTCDTKSKAIGLPSLERVSYKTNGHKLVTRLARLISYTHDTSDYRQCSHVGNTAQHCRLGLFRDSDFAGDFEDYNSLGVESYVSLGVEHSSPLVGSTRNIRQYQTVLQNKKLLRWMLD